MEKDSKREKNALVTLMLPVANCPRLTVSHQWDQLPASTPETSCLVGQVRLLLVATAEAVPEYRSAPTPDPATLNIRAMGAALHPRCPCRSERQGVPRAPIQLAKKQHHVQPCTISNHTRKHEHDKAPFCAMLNTHQSIHHLARR